MAVHEIEIVNWTKYNPRRDVKSSWFRVDNSFFMDPFISSLTPAQFKVWFFILAECSRRSGGVVKLSQRCTGRVLNLRWPCIEAALEKFESESKIVWRRSDGKTDANEVAELPPIHVQSIARPRNATNERTNERNERSFLRARVRENQAADDDPTTPCPPKKNGAEFSAQGEGKKLRHAAIVLRDKMLGAIRKVGLDEAAAREIVGPLAWAIVEQRWATWENFCLEVQKAYAASENRTYFHRELTESIEALLPEIAAALSNGDFSEPERFEGAEAASAWSG